MRFVKLFFISIVLIFLLLTAISALLPSRVRISRAIDIEASAPAISAEISSPGNWERWNEYVMHLKEKTFFPDSIHGNNIDISWKKRNNNEVLTRWYQHNGKEYTAGFRLLGRGSITTVQWYFDFTFSWYPWEKFSSIIYDAQVGPAMQQSLENLKRITENVH
jgi:hypothetical protein